MIVRTTSGTILLCRSLYARLDYSCGSLLFSDEELYHKMRKYHQNVVRSYPTARGTIMERIKRETKYHYWIGNLLIKAKHFISSDNI